MQNQQKKYGSNMWGWKWSIISFFIISFSAFMLFVVKPKRDLKMQQETEKMTVDSLLEEQKNQE